MFIFWLLICDLSYLFGHCCTLTTFLIMSVQTCPCADQGVCAEYWCWSLTCNSTMSITCYHLWPYLFTYYFRNYCLCPLLLTTFDHKFSLTLIIYVYQFWLHIYGDQVFVCYICLCVTHIGHLKWYFSIRCWSKLEQSLWLWMSFPCNMSLILVNMNDVTYLFFIAPVMLPSMLPFYQHPLLFDLWWSITLSCWHFAELCLSELRFSGIHIMMYQM